MVAARVSCRSRGLLQRRGSSAPLTIDPGQLEIVLQQSSSTILENEEYKERKMKTIGPLTRYQLRHLDIQSSISTIFNEFAMLPSPTYALCEKVAGCGAKNRHSVWPIRETRVRLKMSAKLSCNSRTSCNDYINANYILHSSMEPRFIATEGPMTNTVNEFWSMIFQERVPVIVMITNLDEQADPTNKTTLQKKCEKYWPDDQAQYGLIEVITLSCTSHFGMEIRQLLLKCGNKEHHLRHIWFTKWLDHRLPIYHINKVLRLIVIMEAYRNEHRRMHGSTGPVVVHCSAGIGRTCTFIGIALGVEQLYRTPDNIDIFSIISRLRMQRYGAVQFPGQYVFIYLALKKMEKILSESAGVDENCYPVCFENPDSIDEEKSCDADDVCDDGLLMLAHNLMGSNFN